LKGDDLRGREQLALVPRRVYSAKPDLWLNPETLEDSPTTSWYFHSIASIFAVILQAFASLR